MFDLCKGIFSVVLPQGYFMGKWSFSSELKGPISRFYCAYFFRMSKNSIGDFLENDFFNLRPPPIL